MWFPLRNVVQVHRMLRGDEESEERNCMQVFIFVKFCIFTMQAEVNNDCFWKLYKVHGSSCLCYYMSFWR